MPRRVNDYRGLAEVSRVLLLEAVQRHSGSRLKELAEDVGLHINTARDHLNVLIDEGFVCLEQVSTGSRGRPPMVYRPVDDPETNEAARERIIRAQEHRRLLESVTQGRGAQPSQLDDLSEDARAQFDLIYEHLDDSGMEPVPDDEEMRIALAPCPHYRLVGEDRKIACGMHANLVRNLLHQVPGPLELDRLLPFTSTDTCQILLRDRNCPGSECRSDGTELVGDRCEDAAPVRDSSEPPVRDSAEPRSPSPKDDGQ